MVIGPGVNIADGAVIRSFSHIVEATIGKKASSGPMRGCGRAALGEDAISAISSRSRPRRIEAGAKANHLAYLGDASVGAGANIGAGTITCNYDGFASTAPRSARVPSSASNSSLVAPVKIGEGAYIGSGSVITERARRCAGARPRPADRPRRRREALPRAEGARQIPKGSWVVATVESSVPKRIFFATFHQKSLGKCGLNCGGAEC